MPRLEIHDVGKRYGPVWALRHVSLSVDRGVLGLLGPNGAGKSTLMRILATVSPATEGDVLWEGEPVSRDPDAVRRTLGYLPQHFGVYGNLTAREFLEYLAVAKGLTGVAARRRVEELLDVVDLRQARDRRLAGFSGGMRQRVGVAQALLNDPRLLIVDEPAAGLDPEARARFRSLLSELGRERIVLLSTHAIADVGAIAERLAILCGGRLIADERPHELLATVAGRVWECLAPAELLPDLQRNYLVASVAYAPEGATVRVLSPESPAPGARRVPPALEDAYRWLVSGRDGRPGAASPAEPGR